MSYLANQEYVGVWLDLARDREAPQSQDTRYESHLQTDGLPRLGGAWPSTC